MKLKLSIALSLCTCIAIALLIATSVSADDDIGLGKKFNYNSNCEICEISPYACVAIEMNIRATPFANQVAWDWGSFEDVRRTCFGRILDCVVYEHFSKYAYETFEEEADAIMLLKKTYLEHVLIEHYEWIVSVCWNITRDYLPPSKTYCVSDGWVPPPPLPSPRVVGFGWKYESHAEPGVYHYIFFRGHCHYDHVCYIDYRC
jgi:hypothetical protein